MNLIFILIASALLACVIPLGLWVFNFGSTSLAAQSIEWSNFGSYIGGVLSPILAFLSFIGLLLTINAQRKEAARLQTENDNLNYFNHAVKSLERAYIALTSKGPKTTEGNESLPDEPIQNRLAWLTCARLLLSANEVSQRISKESTGLQALYEGEREHWRHQFYELFNQERTRTMLLNGSYFGDPQVVGGPQIEQRSIRVIFEFIEWPDAKVDPIDRVERYSMKEIEEMKGQMFGVKRYLLALHGKTFGQ